MTTWFNRHDRTMTLVVMRRELRDALRDWRIVIPILLLTIAFPALMNFTAQRLVGFAQRFGGALVANQLIPFLLLVVGFFPTSFSLIIALETFVGEKERKSLEPLLATPLTNLQLYIGKMLAALVPPLAASYLGMGVYLLGLRLSLGWIPAWSLLLQTMLLTTVQGIIMVAAAVVVSSQTTSVRAANLLASFIIVPMALLIQGEAAAMFWGNQVGLWWLVVGLMLTAVVLIRMGISIFNREELLGRDIDHIRLGWMGRQVWQQFTGQVNGRYPSPRQWYRQTLALIPGLQTAVGAVLLVGLAAFTLGYRLAGVYPFPPSLQTALSSAHSWQHLPLLQLFSPTAPAAIVAQNIRVIILQGILGVFTLGVLGLLVFALPWGAMGFMAGQVALVGANPLTFLLAANLPQALVELPALLLMAAAALRWHAVVITPQRQHTVSESFLAAAADFARLLIGVAIPLLLVAGLLKAYLSPLLWDWFG